jgi:hypothetical protein
MKLKTPRRSSGGAFSFEPSMRLPPPVAASMRWRTVKELFVLFLVAMLVVPPIVGIRRVRRFFRDQSRRDPP